NNNLCTNSRAEMNDAKEIPIQKKNTASPDRMQPTFIDKESQRSQHTVAKPKRVGASVGLSLACWFLMGPSGCVSPGGLPHPPGLGAVRQQNKARVTMTRSVVPVENAMRKL
ncbi:MAG: hypothetical protein ACXWKH_17090, partial [Limisphaerales bacterium]